MSNVNIKRTIENIRSGTNVHTPLVEVIVNAIQAIEEDGNKNGEIEITPLRGKQLSLEDSSREITGFKVRDNGIGFTKNNRDSFDTLYTEHKLTEGGKGFGRFTCLKYFEHVHIKSVYKDGSRYFQRSFSMGKDKEIIINEKITETEKNETGSTVLLSQLTKTRFPDKNLTTLARELTEKLLPYFTNKETPPPTISITEEDDSESIVLNDYFQNQDQIKEIESASEEFTLNGKDKAYNFSARVFKFYAPRSEVSKVSLVAHRREVTNSSLHKYIPEFANEFYDKNPNGIDIKNKNFIIKVYVFGEYLDKHVSLERGGFDFQKDSDVIYGISQTQIEEIASELASNAVNKDVEARFLKKVQKVKEYVASKAPWHTSLLRDVDLKDLPFNATDVQIETKLQQKKFEQETKVRQDVKSIIETGTSKDLTEKASDIAHRISESSKNDLAHYIALRRSVIDLLDKSLNIQNDGKYQTEGIVHNIIFPRRNDTDTLSFENHNLWLVDERLNFTEYLSSDLPVMTNDDRPDLLAFNKRVVFRSENEPSNPVTIFELKRPHRDDFVNPSSKDDPIAQIIRYTLSIKEGEFRTPQGREIRISDNTPFYGYVVCELTPKVVKWLENEKDFKPMPDRLGYFRWHDNINLYLEVISWEKVLKDASMRNRIFFHHLNIS